MREINYVAVCVPVCSFPSPGRWDKAAGFGECLCRREGRIKMRPKHTSWKDFFGLDIQETMLQSRQIHTHAPMGSESNPWHNWPNSFYVCVCTCDWVEVIDWPAIDIIRQDKCLKMGAYWSKLGYVDTRHWAHLSRVGDRRKLNSLNSAWRL